MKNWWWWSDQNEGWFFAKEEWQKGVVVVGAVSQPDTDLAMDVMLLARLPKNKMVEIIEKSLSKEDGLVLLLLNEELFIWGKGEVVVAIKRGEVLGKVFRGKEQWSKVVGRYVKGDLVMVGKEEELKKIIQKQASDYIKSRVKGEKTRAGVVVLGEQRKSITIQVKEWWLKKKKLIKRDRPKEEAPVYVVGEEGKRKKKLKRKKVVAVGVLAGVMVMGVLSWQIIAKRREEAWLKIIGPIRAELQSLEGGAASAGMAPSVKGLVDKVNTLLNEKKWSAKQGKELAQIKDEAQKTYDKVLGVKRVEPQVYLDLSLIRQNFFGERMAVVGSELMILDAKAGVVVGVGITRKSSRIVAGGEKLIGAKLIAGGEETGWVLTNDGIMKLSKNNVDLAVPKEDKWTEIKALATYGESVYLLDTGKSEIYKYRQDEQGEWKESRWLAPGIAPNFSKVIDMAVDGNVWLLDEDGTLRKFAKGAPNKLAANELGEPIEKACCVAVNGGVWVVDRGKDKVIEFDEDGKYKQQVVGGNLGLVTDVVVIDNKIWMLAGNKLYVLEDW